MREGNNRSLIGIGFSLFRYAVTITMVAMVGMVFVNAVLRYAFQSGIPEVEELSRYLFIWICFLGTIAAFKDNQHVGVDLVISYLKGTPKVVVTVIGHLFILFALAIMLIGGISFMNTGGAAEGPATGIPFGYMAVSIVIASIIMAGILLFNIFRTIKNRTEGC